MVVTSNIERYTLYGFSCWYDKKDNKHRVCINNKVIEKDCRTDLAYYIQTLQSGVGVVH